MEKSEKFQIVAFLRSAAVMTVDSFLAHPITREKRLISVRVKN